MIAAPNDVEPRDIENLTSNPMAALTAALAAGVTVAIGMLFWKTRVQYFEYGSDIPSSPRFATVEAPPEELDVEARCPSPSGGLLLTTLLLYVAFWGSLVLTMWREVVKNEGLFPDFHIIWLLLPTSLRHFLLWLRSAFASCLLCALLFLPHCVS